MRVITAGCFVMTVVFGLVALLGALDLFETTSPKLLSAVFVLLVPFLCVVALWLFNARSVNPLGLMKPEEHMRYLVDNDLLESVDFQSRRAFVVEEYEDEGLHYYLELTDGRVLFLSGQYLYDFEPITDDPELNQERQFPCSDFTIVRHRKEGYVVDIRCRGRILEPEVAAPPFGKVVWREGGVPKDGEIIVETSYDALKHLRLHGDNVG